MKTKILMFLLCVGVLAVGVVPATAGPIYSFYQITQNGNLLVADQLSVEVSDLGSNQVAFIFRNEGSIASSITGVYFDDGTLFEIASITNGTGVSFNSPATPGNLPAGNSIVPPFVTTKVSHMNI